MTEEVTTSQQEQLPVKESENENQQVKDQEHTQEQKQEPAEAAASDHQQKQPDTNADAQNKQEEKDGDATNEEVKDDDQQQQKPEQENELEQEKKQDEEVKAEDNQQQQEEAQNLPDTENNSQNQDEHHNQNDNQVDDKQIPLPDENEKQQIKIDENKKLDLNDDAQKEAEPKMDISLMFLGMQPEIEKILYEMLGGEFFEPTQGLKLQVKGTQNMGAEEEQENDQQQLKEPNIFNFQNAEEKKFDAPDLDDDIDISDLILSPDNLLRKNSLSNISSRYKQMTTQSPRRLQRNINISRGKTILMSKEDSQDGINKELTSLMHEAQGELHEVIEEFLKNREKIEEIFDGYASTKEKRVKMWDIQQVLQKIEERFGLDIDPFQKFLTHRFMLDQSYFAINFSQFYRALQEWCSAEHLKATLKSRVYPGNSQTTKLLLAEKTRSLELITFKLNTYMDKIRSVIEDMLYDDGQDEHTTEERKVKPNMLKSIWYAVSKAINVVIVWDGTSYDPEKPIENNPDCIDELCKYAFTNWKLNPNGLVIKRQPTTFSLDEKLKGVLKHDTKTWTEPKSPKYNLDDLASENNDSPVHQVIKFEDDVLLTEMEPLMDQPLFKVDFILYIIDKFLSERKTIVAVALDNELETYQKRRQLEKEALMEEFDELDEFLLKGGSQKEFSFKQTKKVVPEDHDAQQDNITQQQQQQQQVAVVSDFGMNSTDNNDKYQQQQDFTPELSQANENMQIESQEYQVQQSNSQELQSEIKLIEDFTGILELLSTIYESNEKATGKAIQLFNQILGELEKSAADNNERIAGLLKDKQVVNLINKIEQIQNADKEEKQSARKSQEPEQQEDETSYEQCVKNLNEIHSFYCKAKPMKSKDFDQAKNQMLSLQAFASFCRDFKIPLDKQKVTQVWRKCSSNNQALTVDEFQNSVPKIAVACNKQKQEQISKKIKQATSADEKTKLQQELVLLKRDEQNTDTMNFIKMVQELEINDQAKYRQKMISANPNVVNFKTLETQSNKKSQASKKTNSSLNSKIQGKTGLILTKQQLTSIKLTLNQIMTELTRNQANNNAINTQLTNQLENYVQETNTYQDGSMQKNKNMQQKQQDEQKLPKNEKPKKQITTLDDINTMHYSALIGGGTSDNSQYNSSEIFRPSDFIDYGTGDSDDEILLKFNNQRDKQVNHQSHHHHDPKLNKDGVTTSTSNFPIQLGPNEGKFISLADLQQQQIRAQHFKQQSPRFASSNNPFDVYQNQSFISSNNKINAMHQESARNTNDDPLTPVNKMNQLQAADISLNSYHNTPNQGIKLKAQKLRMNQESVNSPHQQQKQNLINYKAPSQNQSQHKSAKEINLKHSRLAKNKIPLSSSSKPIVAQLPKTGSKQQILLQQNPNQKRVFQKQHHSRQEDSLILKEDFIINDKTPNSFGNNKSRSIPPASIHHVSSKRADGVPTKLETISHSVPVQSEEGSLNNMSLTNKKNNRRSLNNNKNSYGGVPNTSSIKSLEMPKPVSMKRSSLQPNRAATESNTANQNTESIVSGLNGHGGINGPMGKRQSVSTHHHIHKKDYSNMRQRVMQIQDQEAQIQGAKNDRASKIMKMQDRQLQRGLQVANKHAI